MSGFQSPNYTQTPNDLFDELLPEMGLAELKVVMCIVRHTFGYHKENVKLSLRAIARFTGLTANSVMDGAKKAEDHGLIERQVDGNKTTTWSAIVSVVPTKTRRITSRDASVAPTETLLGVKERKEKNKDLLDGILHYQLHPKTIRDAMATHFHLTPNWEAKYNKQFMEWAVEIKMTPEQVEKAADLWRRDKRFNWAAPSLRGIQEHWLELVNSELTRKDMVELL